MSGRLTADARNGLLENVSSGVWGAVPLGPVRSHGGWLWDSRAGRVNRGSLTLGSMLINVADLFLYMCPEVHTMATSNRMQNQTNPRAEKVDSAPPGRSFPGFSFLDAN